MVAVTANAMKGDRERLLEAGFDEYIREADRRAAPCRSNFAVLAAAEEA